MNSAARRRSELRQSGAIDVGQRLRERAGMMDVRDDLHAPGPVEADALEGANESPDVEVTFTTQLPVAHGVLEQGPDLLPVRVVELDAEDLLARDRGKVF